MLKNTVSSIRGFIELRIKKCFFVTYLKTIEIRFKIGYTKNEKKERMIRMSVLSINQNNFDEVLNSEKRVLLDFYADWCNPCRMVSPLLEQIAQENPQYLVGKINVDEEPELAEKFGVSGIPTLVVMQNGKIIKQSSGARPKHQILSLLED